MKLKVAVASSDGKVINSHFGRTKQFLIFEIDKEGFEFLELRTNQPGCSSVSDAPGTMEETIQLISDCQYVLSSQIGPGMVQRLAAINILGMSKPTLIEEGLEELIEGL